MLTQKRWEKKNEFREKERKKTAGVRRRLHVQNMMQAWEISNWIFEPFTPTYNFSTLT